MSQRCPYPECCRGFWFTQNTCIRGTSRIVLKCCVAVSLCSRVIPVNLIIAGFCRPHLTCLHPCHAIKATWGYSASARISWTCGQQHTWPPFRPQLLKVLQVSRLPRHAPGPEIQTPLMCPIIWISGTLLLVVLSLCFPIVLGIVFFFLRQRLNLSHHVSWQVL